MHLAAFSNPDFYKKQAMGFSTYGTPRIIYCGSDTEKYICLPRGCLEKVLEQAKTADIPVKLEDERNYGHEIRVTFQGTLYPEQQSAAEKMLSHENGILAAATAFGKTAVGSYLVAARKVNTLVLVHNREIMKNWVEDFEKFLVIDEDLPTYQTPSGRVKHHKSLIGTLYASHNSLTGIIDVAMIGSVGKQDEINGLVKDYGMVIMDECHHSGAQTADNVMRAVNAKYIYGLTATPKRDDGREQQVYFQFGGIRYRFTAKDKAIQQGVEHYVYPRFTRLVNTCGESWKIQKAYQELVSCEVRNQQIISDVKKCIQTGRTPLILTRFKEHASLLYDALRNEVQNIFLLQGGKSNKERELLRRQLKQVPDDESVAVVATGQYIGEGFNFPRLDTLFLAVPIAWQGVVEQYAGRLHRDFEGKENTIIYDYVDSHIPVLEKMYHKRLRAYKKIGYEICSDIVPKNETTHGAIFDCTTYSSAYEADIKAATKEIIISSPGLNGKKVNQLIEWITEQQEKGVSVAVLTLKTECYPEKRIRPTEELIRRMTVHGIAVREFASMHEHYAIIDRELVWYGSMNLLSREKDEDNLLRVRSKEIAQELIERSFLV